MGELIVNRITGNSIFVTWQNLRCYAGSGVLNSPSFILVTDGYPISFSLSFTCSGNVSLAVQKNESKIGRGIVSLGIMKEATGAIMMICLNEAWGQSCPFNDILTLSSAYYSSLKINCKITWLGFIADIPSPKHQLSLLSIENVPFDNTIFPDFTIISEGRELPSHKTILAGHSPFFSTMFKTPMKESEENKVTIQDVGYSTVETLLKIMYTGQTEDLNEIDTALKVFQAATMYQMSAIRILCEYKLQQKIQVDNVLLLLAEADKHNAALLCETCVAYILAAKDDKITEEFKKISEKPNIIFAIMNVFMNQLFSIPPQNK